MNPTKSDIEMDAYLTERVKFITPTGCYEWQAKIGNWGYPVVSRHQKHHVGHKFIYERLFGKIPEGWQVDHLCSNRKCVNPQHLEAVPKAENIRRGAKNRRVKPVVTVCKWGHPKKQLESGVWICPECSRLSQQRHREKKRKLKPRGPANYDKTHCPNGHEYTPENTKLSGGWRQCRTCHREWQKKYYQRKRLES